MKENAIATDKRKLEVVLVGRCETVFGKHTVLIDIERLKELLLLAPKLSDEDREKLCGDITLEPIENSIEGIPKCKAPKPH